MEKDYKRFLRAVLIIILTALCGMKLPHSSKSIIYFIAPPIKISEGSRLYLTGLLVIFPLLWSYKEIVRSNYFNTNKFITFILVFYLIMPIIFKGVNLIKAPYYTFSKGLRTIEVVDSKLDFDFNSESKNKIKFEIHLKNYSNEMKVFNISVGIPESLNTIISDSSVIVPDKYMIRPHQTRTYNNMVEFNYADGYSIGDIFDTYYSYDDYQIRLFNESDELVIIFNDSF